MNHIEPGLIAGIIGVPFLLITIWVFYLAHAYTEKAELLMPNSSFVQANKGMLSQAGLMGKAIRNGVLTLVLLTPSLAAKRGIVDVADVKNFPNGLRRMLVVSWGLSFLLSVALMILSGYLKYIE
ncbi:hypothetical protein AEQ67_12580 [Pseudomonas sp. RIT-PI-q]|uniref:hypothetical protein n=1 Tax=Pseudomonas sp. RIT-PI-q TaxID=1690247 RepID=UPI0006CDC9B4|nr:hypothetical protein [Pseudomonas sp. RIT-PI-q]KPG98192.1 hypothetical protein AEQ67_12580 [Pseudomonas sp. RIT-PI-q]